MGSISSYMSMNLQSLQSSLSVLTLDKAMSADAASLDAMLVDFAQANPVQPIPVGAVGHNLDVMA